MKAGERQRNRQRPPAERPRVSLFPRSFRFRLSWPIECGFGHGFLVFILAFRRSSSRFVSTRPRNSMRSRYPSFARLCTSRSFLRPVRSTYAIQSIFDFITVFNFGAWLSLSSRPAVNAVPAVLVVAIGVDRLLPSCLVQFLLIEPGGLGSNREGRDTGRRSAATLFCSVPLSPALTLFSALAVLFHFSPPFARCN